METKVDTYYHLYVGDKFIVQTFATCQAALDFGNQHKQICEDCRDKPLKIEKIHTTCEVSVIYDGNKPAKPVMFHIDLPIDPPYV